MTVIELKKMITTFLKTKSSRVFNKQAPAGVQYPYVIYTLERSETNENQVMEEFDLVIEVYDNNQFDSTALDTLVGSIDGDGNISAASGLHRKHYHVANTLNASFYRYSREEVEQKDQVINCVELSYDVLVYLS